MTKKEAIMIVKSILDEVISDSEFDTRIAKRIVEALPIKGIRS
jgi:hypothetical protein